MRQGAADRRVLCQNLECEVVDTKLVAKYNFFVLEVVQAWIDRTTKTRAPFIIVAEAFS